MKRMTRRHQGSLRWPNVSRYDERHQGGGTPAPPVPHLLEPPSPQHASIISIYLYMYIFVFNLQALLGAFNRRQTTRRHTRRENIKTQAVVSFPIKMNGNVIICSSVIKTLNFFKRFFNPSKQKTHRTVLYVKLLLPPRHRKKVCIMMMMNLTLGRDETDVTYVIRLMYNVRNFTLTRPAMSGVLWMSFSSFFCKVVDESSSHSGVDHSQVLLPLFPVFSICG